MASKAATWVAKREEAIATVRDCRLLFVNDDTQILGEVTANGHLSSALAFLTPQQAVAYARWILDTFEDAGDTHE